MGDVTPTELWRAVGEQLLLHRTRKGWKPFDVQKNGGPTYKTVQAIDKGRIRRLDMLAEYAAALGLSIVDLLSTILLASAPSLSPESVQIVRKYERTTIEGRRALIALAQALPDAPAEEPSVPRRSPAGPGGKAPRKS